MNHSSLFSFGESSAWDPKVIRKRLVVSEDQLIKLNSIPGWAKVRDNQDTLRLDKDFSIEKSQSECSIYATQNNKRIESNTKLFNEQIEKFKSVLKTCKVYGNKLTRSLSLSSIHKSSGNLNCKTLKRTLSMQNVHESSSASDILNLCKHIRCENIAKNHSQVDLNKAFLQRQFGYITSATQCKTFHSESQKSKELFLSKENSETMETITQLPLNIPTTIEKPFVEENNSMLPAEKSDPPIKHVESMNSDIINLCPETLKEDNNLVLADNVDSHSKTIKDNNSVFSAENIVAQSNNMTDKLKHVAKSMNADKSDLHSETTIENSDELPTVHVNQLTNVSNQPTKPVNDTWNVDNSVSSLKNLAKSCVPVANENNVKEMPAYKISASSLEVQDEKESLILSNVNERSSLIVKKTVSKNCFTSISNANNVPPTILENTKASASVLDGSTLCLSKSPEINKPTEEFTVPDKDVGIAHLIGNSNSDFRVNDAGSDVKMGNEENNPKECDPAKYVKVKCVENDEKVSDPAKSLINNESSSSKKRKLESRNKRSKRLKSEGKQNTLKIRSIKKVGEVCYSVEEVKTMLDIMKQFS